MIVAFRAGRVISVGDVKGTIIRAKVILEDGKELSVINYTELTGPISTGDDVIVNTVATDLALGTGGSGFIVWNLSQREFLSDGPGHIMKLRYTPWQFSTLSVEEGQSPYHEIMEEAAGIERMPVVVGGLHSQLYPIVAAIKSARPDCKVTYIMTDAAALPIALSRTVAGLKAKGWLDATITIGHAFGGDFEAVNIYSGLQAARTVTGADIAVVIMGPGIVGTGTKLGFSGIEQGQIINAAGALNGRSVVAARISFADTRPRHQGLSHHTVTVLKVAALAPATVALPLLEGERRIQLLRQIDESGLAGRHLIEEVDAGAILPMLAAADPALTTMGRGIDEEREFFLAAAAAGLAAVRLLEN